MDTKEEINTIISMGSGLPPVNPYLDDLSQDNDEEETPTAKKGSGRPRANAPKNQPGKATIAPDPKDYIAELERPEEDNLY